MLINLAGAGLAVHGAHAVAVLADFDGGPVALAKGGNQAGHEAGLADVARVPADDDEGHSSWLLALGSGLWALGSGLLATINWVLGTALLPQPRQYRQFLQILPQGACRRAPKN